MTFLTDTHPLLWHFTNNSKISSKAKRIFDKCEKGECVILIPTIVLAESLSIFDKKKVIFDFRGLFERIRKSDNYAIISLDHRVLSQMVETKEVTELHDKIIVATAKLLGLPLITKDRLLARLKTIDSVW